MKKSYRIQERISADVQTVWRVLTQEMPKDPAPFGIARIEGQVAPGRKFKLWSDAAGDRAFSLRVKEMKAPVKMIWQGGMPFGLFKGVRTFELQSKGEVTEFTMTEVFSGPMADWIVKSIPDLSPSFRVFAAQLKYKAEL